MVGEIILHWSISPTANVLRWQQQKLSQRAAETRVYREINLRGKIAIEVHLG
jgi:hypothetical protein